MRTIFPLSALAVAAALSGCASTSVHNAVNADSVVVRDEMGQAKTKFSADVPQPILLPTLHTPYFDGQSVAVAPVRTSLPTALQSTKLIHLKTGVLTTSTLARAISEELGIPVVSDPPPKTDAAKEKAMAKLLDVAALPPMPVQQFLNNAGAALGFDWDWYDNALHLQTNMTRSYQVSNTSSSSKATMKLGKSAQSQAGTTGGTNTGTSGSFSSQMDGEVNSVSDPWADMEASIKSIASGGTVVPNKTLGLFVVTCPRACQKQVKDFVDEANHIMTQQVLFHVVEMTVETTSTGQSGINWNILYQQVASKYSLSFATPTSVVNNSVGNIAFNVLNPTSGSPKGFDGSSAIFNALSAATHVIEAKPFDMLAINNEPTTLSNINQQTFTASTTVVPTGISGTPVYTQNPGYATYGQLIQINPTMLPQQKVMVRFGIDDTKLKQLIASTQPGGMDKVLLGGLTYQTKAILNIGSTLILSGFKVKTSSINEQGLLPGQHLGSEAGERDSTETIIMITPYLAGS